MTTNIEIKETKNKGNGVFASRDFKKGELILRIEGKIAETENNPNLTGFSKEIQDHCFPFEKREKKRKYVLPKAPWKYLNHSCDPNAGIKNNVEIVAMKQINKGEEITFDYAMNNIDNWKTKCSCGSKNCRKIISTFDALDTKTKKKYLPYVIDSIKKKYLSLRY